MGAAVSWLMCFERVAGSLDLASRGVHHKGPAAKIFCLFATAVKMTGLNWQTEFDQKPVRHHRGFNSHWCTRKRCNWEPDSLTGKNCIGFRVDLIAQILHVLRGMPSAMSIDEIPLRIRVPRQQLQTGNHPTDRQVLHDTHERPQTEPGRGPCWSRRNWKNRNNKRPCKSLSKAVRCIQLSGIHGLLIRREVFQRTRNSWSLVLLRWVQQNQHRSLISHCPTAADSLLSQNGEKPNNKIRRKRH